MASDLTISNPYPEPVYCLRCNGVLYAPGQAACPNCGLQYDSNDAATYRQTPQFLRWKYWFPGLCLSIASGVISYALCLTGGDLGFALFVAVPLSFGAILGYATRAHIWLLAFLGIVAVTAVVLVLISMDVAGFFCGLTLGIIFLLPASIGIVMGLVLRSILKSTRWDQRWFLPLVFFMALPYFVQAIESALPRRREIATVRTELTVHATPQEAWNAVMFYEQVEHAPPWLLQLALPKPLYSVGDKTREDEIVRCVYDRGYLSKRISRVEQRSLLAFEVVEQHLHFERDIRLLDGSFALNDAGDGRTRILLTTRYERLLRPRAVWEPIERKVIHTLHGHVLEGMRRKAERPAPHVPTPTPRYHPAPVQLVKGQR